MQSFSQKSQLDFADFACKFCERFRVSPITPLPPFRWHSLPCFEHRWTSVCAFAPCFTVSRGVRIVGHFLPPSDKAMATTLAHQLALLGDNRRVGKASLLYDPRQAADIDLQTLFHVGLNGATPSPRAISRPTRDTALAVPNRPLSPY